MSNHLGDTNKMVSDTPRTDAAWKTTPSVYDFIVEMKRIERELNAANERIKRMEEAGGQLMMWIGEDISDSNRQLLEDHWNKAKEDKP